MSSSNWRDEILNYATGKVLPEWWNNGDNSETIRFKAKLNSPMLYPIKNYFRNNRQNVIDFFLILRKFLRITF